MSIVFTATGVEEFDVASDENGFLWIKVDVPTDEVECWLCEKELVPKNSPVEDRDLDRTVVGTHCWYSVSEAVLYCLNCVTEPKTPRDKRRI